MARRLAAIAIFVFIALQAVGPVRSYDFFWHLATGRWIVEHRALPVYDPFAVASAHVPWVNGEWLYQVALYSGESIAGLHGVSWINALFVAALFALAFWFASRQIDFGTASFATAISFAGAAPLLGIRPAAAAAFLIVVAIGVLQFSSGRQPWNTRSIAIAYALVTIGWINTHPSALLAPLIAGATLIGDWRRWPIPVIGAAALLVNPYGWEGIAAPLRLSRLVASGEFTNIEWMTSTPAQFPLFYATIAGVIVLLIIARPTREEVWRFVVFGGLAVLAIQHVRHQGLYFAALPLLLPRVRVTPRASVILAVCAIVPIALVPVERHTGVDGERFPVLAAAHLQASGLAGNIYNADQFGGYLEWAFYPDRRVLTDGRNELFRDFIALDTRARRDSRAWHELLRRYHVDLAVDEYQRRIDMVDVASGIRRSLPASLVRYPRRDWALVAFDDAAMVFARRAAFSAARIRQIEYRELVPDDPSAAYTTPAARAEIARAQREIGNIGVVRKLAARATD